VRNLLRTQALLVRSLHNDFEGSTLTRVPKTPPFELPERLGRGLFETSRAPRLLPWAEPSTFPTMALIKEGSRSAALSPLRAGFSFSY
jgi:hypothetical protein